MLLLVLAKVNKLRPGMMQFKYLKSSDIEKLSVTHISLIFILMIPSFIIKDPPVFLLMVPNSVGIIKIAVFSICTILVLLMPWDKFDDLLFQRNEPRRPYLNSISYISIRIIYLAVYEWFFRGLLLISLQTVLGTTWAILFNTILYTLAHFHKDKKEMIGCIPLGISLCIITLWWQSVWPAVLIHLLISMINEWPAIKRLLLNPKKTLQ